MRGICISAYYYIYLFCIINVCDTCRVRMCYRQSDNSSFKITIFSTMFEIKIILYFEYFGKREIYITLKMRLPVINHNCVNTGLIRNSLVEPY